MSGVLSPPRRSPIEEWLAQATEGTRLRQGMVQPLQLHSTTLQGTAVSLTELSWRRRLGLKGPGAEAWLGAQGFAPAPAANSWQRVGGALVGRLANSEFLVEALDAGAQTAVASAAAVLYSAVRPVGVYPVVRQDLVLRLQGPELNTLLRQICGVNFKPLLADAPAERGTLLMTSMIGAGVVAIPMRVASATELILWVDPSFAMYFWTTLLQVAAELGGGVLLDPSTEV